MSTPPGEFGIVGLGRMGGGLALHARDLGLRVVGTDAAGLRGDLKQAGVIDANGQAVIDSLNDIPSDIQPIYPDRL